MRCEATARDVLDSNQRPRLSAPPEPRHQQLSRALPLSYRNDWLGRRHFCSLTIASPEVFTTCA